MRLSTKKTARKSQAKASKPKKTAVKCPNYTAVIGSSGDLNRHIKTHDPTQTKQHCPYVGCPYRTVQKTNLTTHLRFKHTDCDFTCTDPGYLSKRYTDRRHETDHLLKTLQHQFAKSALLPMIPMLAQSFCALSLLPLDINMVARTGRLTIRSQSTRTTTFVSSLYINVRRLCLII
ncbi:hypothetical protein BT96DRAFT_923362 [Gymnopus androsaceus JB14]|uniref:C2H2-type domain-containing protein n=1 Tax=Gymnopus androsaceus JB14 TaxID=1447944 RepID=A0A6A4H901_9AGAR|nr:hypothetical protein BT96DRAFT_923362 [Gymnopus androsaceus JB14]